MKATILSVPRGTGITTWIIKSLVHNSDVIVVCLNDKTASNMEGDFKRELSTHPPKTMTWPGFVSIKKFQDMKIDRPVIFDNSCYCDSEIGIIIKHFQERR